ncbi:MAG: hypothetical protein IKW21_01225 [Lachnospiraceae bacterium]|nr:hypothetical protein [Lachnospiraceae bacterium]
MGQGSRYVVLTVKHFWAVQKAVTSWNAEGKWKVMKMMNFIKETGKVLLFGIGVWSPFALHVLGVL